MRYPRVRRWICCIGGSASWASCGYQTLTARALWLAPMLASIFQNSKSALAFAASVIVCALMLVGPKESGGVLDKAVETYKDERANIASDAANMSAQMSMPQIADYNPAASGMEEPLEGGDSAPDYSAPDSRVVRIGPATGQATGFMPSSPVGNDADAGNTVGANPNPAADISALAAPPVAAPPASQAVPAAPVRGQAVVTSRMIRIQPQP